jgi:hypothetical protein
MLTIFELNCQSVRYSPAWFGPNANPVPELTDAKIPSETTIELMADYYTGFGDITQNGYWKIEIPLIPKSVSFKLWSTLFENYQVSDNIFTLRNMVENKGIANGDIYVQTRISLNKERKNLPAIILNTTLKTASGTNFINKRYFDTPGYYFDIESSKSFIINSLLINEIRIAADLGFMCWETTNSRQDDALLYGIQLNIHSGNFIIGNYIGGYDGWMHKHPSYCYDYGDSPLVYKFKLQYSAKKTAYFLQYQYGIKDFPYHNLRAGIAFRIRALTPKFKTE